MFIEHKERINNMHILTLSEISNLKSLIKNKFNTTLYFHDSRRCQAFSLKKSDENVKKFITAYFIAKKIKSCFFDDRKQFSTEELSYA